MAGGGVLPMASALVGDVLSRRVNDAGILVVGEAWADGLFDFLLYGDAGGRSGACGGAGYRPSGRGTSGAGRWTTRRRPRRRRGRWTSAARLLGGDLTFGRCAAYAADQDADSTAVGWAEAYASASVAQAAALSECRSRGGGSGCIVRAWGCNGPVVEEGLSLDLAARRQIQQGLAAGGFDPGGADGLFGPRTRAAIRRWQSSRGARSTGYLDGASAEALRSTGSAGRAVCGCSRRLRLRRSRRRSSLRRRARRLALRRPARSWRACSGSRS